MKSIPSTFLLGVLLCLGGCATPVPPATMSSWLPAGYYKFDCPGIYDNGLARLEPSANGVRVQLLEKIKGSFEFHAKPDGSLEIRESEMDYPGLRRSFKGKGRVTGAGTAGGQAVVWVKNFGFAGRDHRTAEWTLRPAHAEEIEKYEARERSLEERKRKAGMLE